MSTASESSLLGPDEGPAARVWNPHGSGRLVLVCEHASRFLPASVGTLGLDEDALASHVAWDPGAMELAVELMAAFDAPLVASRVSRLVYDCNRPPDAPDAIPARSERFAIPGNRSLGETEVSRRVSEVYLPFRNLLSRTLETCGPEAVVVTVHSFTPVYNGQHRAVELGLLHDSDDRLARAMAEASGEMPLRTALNEPYSARDGVTHTLRTHAVPAGFANVMLEIRNDLLATPTGLRRVAAEVERRLRSGLRALEERSSANGTTQERGPRAR